MVIFFVVFFCVVLVCIFRYLVRCCDALYDFGKKLMFGSAVPEVVCRTAHVLLTFTLFVFVWVEWGVEVRGNCSFFFILVSL